MRIKRPYMLVRMGNSHPSSPGPNQAFAQAQQDDSVPKNWQTINSSKFRLRAWMRIQVKMRDPNLIITYYSAILSSSSFLHDVDRF